MTDEKIPGYEKRFPTRPQRVMLPPSDFIDSYLLEIFELDSNPEKRHAVWLHRLKAGGFQWKCTCGAQRTHHALDAALLVEARSHFEQAWNPAPVGNFACLWNDRVMQSHLRVPRILNASRVTCSRLPTS